MSEGWFADIDPDDPEGAVRAIRDGSADAPDEWPTIAVESGFATDTEEYYERLREVTIDAASEAVRERERADDAQLVHAVRAMDDADRIANELAERVAEWGGSLFSESGSGVEYARRLADREPRGPAEERAIALAVRTVEVADEAEALRVFIERATPTAAPNLAALAGPVLAARLIALAGGLGELAKKPSGTLQVLGAEDALFAHLRGHAPSPKHGVIYTHEYVRGTRHADRGSAARALAGKLTIAARVDHYAGDRRPELEEELDERIATIQARGES
ncbi:NOP5/NOP56 family protein [Halalkalicoccus jeotgali]|uniref:Nucleolar protein-like protein n=1 Tax=Halalkalicoccus jeotgali (strain DSM 18796 / CECT 7217 / JCM 14584 / KCTC 4019 / B3) TaxID=795797 RepID=D8J2I6_HALJB|nr:NOP5/NOP56 family protein [Halalkalicoccus jeotgali]ADJ14943.1 nucleolar protein-like protein [Halalkalicoccus jeotgali B3]ELY35041.1 nucleolar protein-like protein [Halalkalicoccus jeotgali B3]